MCSKVQINYASATSLIYLICYGPNKIEQPTESWLSSKPAASRTNHLSDMHGTWAFVSSSSLRMILQNIHFGVVVFSSGPSRKYPACIYLPRRVALTLKHLREKDKWKIITIKWKDINWEGKEKRGKCSHNAVLQSDDSWVISCHHDQVWIDIDNPPVQILEQPLCHSPAAARFWSQSPLENKSHSGSPGCSAFWTYCIFAHEK